MDDGEFNHSGGVGGGGGPVAVAAAAMAVADDRDRWQWHWMAMAALDGGHATTSRCSERAAQQENKRAVQGVATQQPVNLSPRRHFDVRIVICHAAMVLPCIVV